MRQDEMPHGINIDRMTISLNLSPLASHHLEVIKTGKLSKGNQETVINYIEEK